MPMTLGSQVVFLLPNIALFTPYLLYPFLPNSPNLSCVFHTSQVLVYSSFSLSFSFCLCLCLLPSELSALTLLTATWN